MLGRILILALLLICGGPLAAAARYNAAVPSGQRAGLDFISWQDYAWSSDRLSDGAEGVSRQPAQETAFGTGRSALMALDIRAQQSYALKVE